MFQFTWFPLPVLCVHTGVIPLYKYRVSPFGHPRIEAQSAAPRGLSQPLTSFIGRRHQGIHRWLFVAWKIRTSKNSNFDQMLVLAMQFSKSTGGFRKTKASAQSLGRDNHAPSKRKRGQKKPVHQLGVSEPDSTIWRYQVETELLRKEVIQPHLPVRLPCYDFTPIANPTFGSSLSKELGH